MEREEGDREMEGKREERRKVGKEVMRKKEKKIERGLAKLKFSHLIFLTSSNFSKTLGVIFTIE